MLACGSLGLIGLSRFLHYSVSFFLPQPFLAVVVVFALVIPLHSISTTHTTTSCLPKQAQSFPHSIALRSFSFHHFRPCPAPQKNFTTRKKTRQPCVFHVTSRSPHSASLHSGLSRVCHPRSTRRRLAPLHYAGKKITPLSLRQFFTCSVPAQGCFTCVVFVLHPRQPPTTPP
jgi:hypothetical protein